MVRNFFFAPKSLIRMKGAKNVCVKMESVIQPNSHQEFIHKLFLSAPLVMLAWMLYSSTSSRGW